MKSLCQILKPFNTSRFDSMIPPCSWKYKGSLSSDRWQQYSDSRWRVIQEVPSSDTTHSNLPKDHSKTWLPTSWTTPIHTECTPAEGWYWVQHQCHTKGQLVSSQEFLQQGCRLCLHAVLTQLSNTLWRSCRSLESQATLSFYLRTGP